MCLFKFQIAVLKISSAVKLISNGQWNFFLHGVFLFYILLAAFYSNEIVMHRNYTLIQIISSGKIFWSYYYFLMSSHKSSRSNEISALSDSQKKKKKQNKTTSIYFEKFCMQKLLSNILEGASCNCLLAKERTSLHHTLPWRRRPGMY